MIYLEIFTGALVFGLGLGVAFVITGMALAALDAAIN
jgi:hypothetical protein|tara:strand:+ start:571 stop:681 length:111 start_codon:yes stop_codon:yes gene_type:complete